MIDRHAVVWGASGGIGGALVEALAASGRYAIIHAGSRSPPHGEQSKLVRPFAFDLLDEGSIAAAATAITAAGTVDDTIVATGMLHDIGQQPEKSLASLSADAMMVAFRINTIGPALIAKHMIQALPKDRRSVLAALSARVGSIGDNRLGGWHSYRASKAALNMIIANLATELRRTRPLAIVIGLHPGTVDTRLSAPFQTNVPEGKLLAPAISAAHLLSVIGTLTQEASGMVVDWKGEPIPA